MFRIPTATGLDDLVQSGIHILSHPLGIAADAPAGAGVREKIPARKPFK